MSLRGPQRGWDQVLFADESSVDRFPGLVGGERWLFPALKVMMIPNPNLVLLLVLFADGFFVVKSPTDDRLGCGSTVHAVAECPNREKSCELCGLGTQCR
jgi:hypothetical protein